MTVTGHLLLLLLLQKELLQEELVSRVAPHAAEGGDGKHHGAAGHRDETGVRRV